MERTLLVAWAAGFFDGEGSVSIVPRRNSYKNKAGITRWSVMLIMNAGQRVRAPLERLQELFGGAVSAKQNSAGVYYWKAGTQDARNALQEMLPYLVVKRKQAEIAIEYALTIQTHWKRKRLTEDQLMAKWEYVEKMRRLNGLDRSPERWASRYSKNWTPPGIAR